MDYKTYEINGKIYEHRPQVLGQLKQLQELLGGVTITGGIDAARLVALLGTRLPAALAIVLTEQGKSPRDKDMDALAGELEYALNLEQIMEIVDDFFSINPLSSVFEKVVGLMTRFTDQMLRQTGLSSSASPSATETSQGETASPGA